MFKLLEISTNNQTWCCPTRGRHEHVAHFNESLQHCFDNNESIRIGSIFWGNVHTKRKMRSYKKGWNHERAHKRELKCHLK